MACSCGSIWFWSKWAAGNVISCCVCDPIPEGVKPRRGPGILQDDGSILTPKLVTKSIEKANRAGDLKLAAEELGGGWKPFRFTGAVSSPPARRLTAAFSLQRLPDELVISPGDDAWVDMVEVERRREREATLSPTVGAGIPAVVTGTASRNKRLARKAARQ